MCLTYEYDNYSKYKVFPKLRRVKDGSREWSRADRAETLTNV